MSDPTPEPTPPPRELSYPDALKLAMNLHRGGQLESAERLYRVLIQAAPGDPNPAHYLGVLLHQRGRGEEGLALIRRSLEIDASVASWHNNLGNILLDTGKLDEAAAAYARCSALDPDNVDVLNNLGVMLRSLKMYGEAEATLKRAIEKKPDFANARTNLASLYYELKRTGEGHKQIAAVLASEPGDPAARKILGLLYATMGQLDEAAKIFRDWMELEPENEQAKHHFAACTRGITAPERASEGYVQQVFDTFAGSFDAKLAALEYRAPELVGAAVARLLGAPEARWQILDAGCGTGLCGPWLAPYAGRLTGVDLSGNMLERARARGHYTQLVKADLVTYLETYDTALDLIVSADTLCYFGRIDSVIKAARRALRSGGYLAFTVESHAEETDYRLNPNGRYSHCESYVRKTLGDAGMDVLGVQIEHLRNEGGNPVMGWLVTARAAR